MPKIPEANFSRRSSLDVGRAPTRAIQEAGIQGRAMQGLGAGIAQVGQGVGSFFEKREKAEAENYLNTAQTELTRDGTKFKEELNNQMSNSDYKDYAKKNQEYIAEKKKQFLDQAPNDKARDAANRYFDQLSNDSFVRDTAYENKQRAQFYLQKDEENRNTRANVAYETADINVATQSYRELNDLTINSENYDAATKAKLLKQNEKIITGALDGMLAQGKGKVLEGLNFLEGKSNSPDGLAALDQKVRAKYTEKFKKAQEYETIQAVSATADVAQNLSTRMDLELQATGRINPATLESSEKALNRLKNLQNLVPDSSKKEQIKDIIDQIEVKHKSLDFQQDLKYKTLQDLQKEDPAAGIDVNDPQSAEKNLKLLTYRQKTLQQYSKRLQEDPVSVAVMEDKTVREGHPEVLEWQKRKGVPNPRVFSEGTADAITNELLTSKNSSVALDSILQRFPLGKQGIVQLAREKKELVPYAIAAEFTDPIARTQFVNINPAQVSKRFKEEISVDEATIKNSFNREMEDIYSALGRNDGYVNTMRDRGVAMVKSEMLNGVDRDTAVERVTERVFKKEFGVIESGKSKILISKSQVKNPDMVKEHLDFYFNDSKIAETVEQFNLDVKDQIGVSGKMDTKTWLEQAIDDGDLRYSLTPNRDGVMMVYNSDDGGPKTVKVKGPQGNPVPLELKFSDMENSTSKYSKMMESKASEKGLFKKFTENISQIKG